MSDSVTLRRTMSNQRPNLGSFVKALMANAILLQAREQGTPTSEELQELVKGSLPLNCHNVSILPVAPVLGRFKDSERYLVIWSSTFEPHYSSLSLDISASAVDTISQRTSRNGSAFLMHRVAKRERDRMVVCLQKLEDEKSTEPAESVGHETILRIIQETFGRPEAKPHFVTFPLPADSAQKGGNADSGNTESRSNRTEVDTSTGGKDERMEDGEIGDNESQASRDDFQHRAGPNSAVGESDLSVGDESGMEALRPMMALLAVARKKKGPAVAVKLVRPPLSHPTTSVLRPVVGRTPSPELEKREEHKKVSPSEYMSNIGNAEIVRSIYLEARTTGTPRTHQEERARRKRAGKIALKEICDVVDQVEWDRRGRNFQDGPFPVSMEGVDQVPQDDRRDWILERRERIRKQRCETRVTVWDNTEAAEHIWAVVEAVTVVVCFEAGEEGVVFE